MCGFVGWVNRNPAGPVDSSVLRAMNRTIAHRGPDDEGYFTHRNVGLGHRRLSIIDLSPLGRQPMFNEDQSVCVLLNGEIYNYLALREILLTAGHKLRSRTDTEILAHAYEQWGDGFIERLDGMYALAVYDLNRSRLLLAKDPFGKKPLYYAQGPRHLLFASEIKALAAHPDFDATLDMAGLGQYLAHDYVPCPRTIYKSCRNLGPGSYIVADTQTAEVSEPRQYWNLEFEPKLELSEGQALEELQTLLREAATKRLMSDVPLGVFLSGGIDSSTVVAQLRLAGCDNIQTFNVGFSEKSFDESGYAAQVAEHFGTEHHQEILHPSTMLDVLPEIIDKLDEPFADYSIIPTYLLCRFARQRITVALGGDGGDELFAGYDPFLAHKFSRVLARLPEFAVNGIRKLTSLLPASEANMSLYFRFKHLLKGYGRREITCPEMRNVIWMGAFTPDAQQELLAGERDHAPAWEETYARALELAASSTAVNTIDRVVDNYARMYLHDDILAKVDRASMMHSLEVRSPLLDKKLAEFVCRLPARMKMKGFIRKYILKKAVSGHLPQGIAERAKKGFGVPLGSWFKGPLRDMLHDVFSETSVKQAGYFQYASIKQLLDEHLSGRHDNRKELWTLLVFELWRRARSR